MRRMWRYSFVFFLGLVLFQCGDAENEIKPNVIFIVTDDQGYADLSAYSHVSEGCRTPNMDRIAENGVLFDRAYVSGPVCSPSRAAIYTGKYQERWDEEKGWGPGLPENVQTVAEILQENGYVTGRVGKSDYGRNYHDPDAREFPVQHGYDSFLGFSAHAHDYFLLDEEIERATPDPYGQSESLGRLFRNKTKEGFKDTYTTELFTDEAISFIKEHKEAPFFLDLAYNSVHELIHEVPDEYLEKWDVRKIPNYDPSYGRYAQYYWDYTQVGKISDEEKRKLYLANLNCLDDNIGRLLDSLEAMNLLENTMIVFISDNGGEPLTGANNLPLSGSKYTMHEGGIRVPFMMSWPKKMSKGQLYSHRVSAFDILPTVMEAVGIEADSLRFDGSSLFEAIHDDVPSESAMKPLCFEFGKQWSIIDKGWKLVFAKDYNPKHRPITSQILLGSNSGELALYNLNEDIGERHNLIEEEPLKAEELQKRFDEWRVEMQEDLPNYRFWEKAESKSEPEERPDVATSIEEQKVNEGRRERNFASSSLKGVQFNSSYAGGKITGSWDQVKFLAANKHSYGFRVDGSVYDQLNDVIYPISYAGHIWKVLRDDDNYANNRWELMNHKGNFKSSYIEGLNMAEGAFRMVRSSDSRMQYSDDEGRSWLDASGLQFVEKTNEGAVSTLSGEHRVFVAGKINSSTIGTYVSTDNGASYSSLSLTFSPYTYKVKMFKACFSESVFLLALNTSTSKISIYECGESDSDFQLVASPSSAFNGLNRVFGTYYEDKFHFYIAGAKTHIYYSDDKGLSWQTKSSTNSGDGDIYPRTVHPTKPNVIFRGYLDVNMSVNNGTTFSNFSHLLGWDVHHMKMYQRADGSYFHFVGKDFGCYYSDTPEDKSSYIQLNNTAPTQMCYDVDHGQHYASSFTATQDRGTMGYDNSSNEAYTRDVKTTDGLRVTIGNNEASVWTWMYYGTIFRQSNFAARTSGLSSVNFTGNWWASPMVPSPNKNEDAIYIAAGESLTKFTYNPLKAELIQTQHYYDFGSATGSTVSGFAYSPINTQRWYVSTKNGMFLYSEDGGQSFERTSYSGIKPTANDQGYNYKKNQHVIKGSMLDEETVYYAGVGNVFLISRDGGKNFTNHSVGLNVYRIRDFDFTEDEKFIFAACAYGGLWVYSVDDDRWYEMNDEAIPYVDFVDVEYMVKEGIVNVGTYGNGVLRFSIDGFVQDIRSPEDLSAEVGLDGLVTLAWDDLSDNEDGFIIERLDKGVFTVVADVASDSESYLDTSKLKPDLYTYRLKAYNTDGASYYSDYVLLEISAEGSVSKEDWELVSVDSEETYSGNPGLASYAFDGDEGTIWHTEWYNISPMPGQPHELVIDMNNTLSLYGFGYLPRQDGSWNGTIAQYEFYLSEDGATWTKVNAGTWSKTKSLKQAYFTSPQEARYLKFRSLSEVNGSVFSSCAELSVYTQLPTVATPKAPQFIQGGMLSDTQLELIWMDLSDDEDGFVVEEWENGSFTPVFTSVQNVTSYKKQNVSSEKRYTFRVKAYNTEGDSDYSEEIVINPGGLVDNIEIGLVESAVSIYPNPVKDQLYMNIGIAGIYSEWQLIDTRGKVVMDGLIPEYANVQNVNVQELEGGIYFVRMRGENRSSSATILKK